VLPMKRKKTAHRKSDNVIVGIDPGLGVTGYGVLELSDGTVTLREAGYIRTNRRTTMAQRLEEIYSGLNSVIDEFKPESIIIEDLYSHYRHPRTAIIMGHARGAVYLSAAFSKVPVKSYGATMIKKSLTGNGRASKQQIQHMIKKALGLKKLPEPADVADALAVALCHIHHSNNSNVRSNYF
jgi:crossover junction endodeoxyribonuclease RuvC